jgi:hypothetical protein
MDMGSGPADPWAWVIAYSGQDTAHGAHCICMAEALFYIMVYHIWPAKNMARGA